MTMRRQILFGLVAGSGLALVVTMAHRNPTETGLPSQAEGGLPPLHRNPISARPSSPIPRERSQLPSMGDLLAPLPDTFLEKLGAALESLQKESNNSTRDQKLDTLASEMATTNIPVALEFLKDQNAFGPARAMNLRLVRRWAEADAKAAAGWVTENLTGTVREESIDGVAIVWANQDLAGAVAWAKQLPEDDRASGLLNVAYEAARTQPITAINLAVELPVGQSQEDVIVHAVRQWASQDAKSAADWAKTITEDVVRNKVLAAVAAEWGASDPAAAATLAVNSVAPGKPQDDAVVGIVQRWVQIQPDEAAAWVTAFPEGPLRDTAMEEVVKLWADQDLQQPAKWLAGLEAGPGRDSAIGAYVGKVAISSPEVALEWAEEIVQERARDHQLESVAANWLRTDAGAARAWIAKAQLSEETKGRLLGLTTK